MTITETYSLLKMLLDDSRFYFITQDIATRLVNEAQVRLVKRAHRENDERCLRPLYVSDSSQANGLPIADNDFLFPRACTWYQTGNYSMVDIGEPLNYQEPQVFFAYEGELGGRSRGGFYTVTIELFDFGQGPVPRPFLYFTAESAANVAKLLYVRYPVPFGANALEVPNEYHPEVVMMAAELANDLDVNESERGTPIFQNQQLSMEDASAAV